MSERTDAIVKQHNEYCGVSEWHSKGFKGQGITVWNCEKRTDDHGSQSAQRVLDSAPECNLITGTVSMRSNVTAVTMCEVVDENRCHHDIHEWIQKNNVRIITASLKDLFEDNDESRGKFWQDIVEQYGIVLINSAGNDGNKNFDFSKRVAWHIGALTLTDGKPKRAGYSSTGEGLDFADLAGWNAGTSFSAPYFAGKCALVLQRFPEFTPQDVYEYMKKCSMDLYTEGEDNLTGWGFPILPVIEDIPKEGEKEEIPMGDITKKTKFEDVPAGVWYEEVLAFDVEKGLLKGITETKFDPDGVLTRAQLAQALYNVYHVVYKDLKKELGK